MSPDQIGLIIAIGFLAIVILKVVYEAMKLMVKLVLLGIGFAIVGLVCMGLYKVFVG